MLHPKESEADVGVIVGRFQVHDLHEGHHSLIESVCARHQKVILFLGSRPGMIVTRTNPMDFPTRRVMVQEHYPNVDVLPIPDQPRDDLWSADLDRRISEVADGKSILLYGSRDGFAAAYQGRHPVIELAETKHVSGSSIRKAVSNKVRASADFRQGIVYASFNRHPTSYQTVDATCIKGRGTPEAELLLCSKRTDAEGLVRFFGGFVQPGRDASLASAAGREFREEAGDIAVHAPVFVGSVAVDDWRYRTEADGIMTALFLFDYFHGVAKASDDVDAVHWRTLSTLKPEHFVPEHRPLFSLLSAYLNGGE